MVLTMSQYINEIEGWFSLLILVRKKDENQTIYDFEDKTKE